MSVYHIAAVAFFVIGAVAGVISIIDAVMNGVYLGDEDEDDF